MIPSVPLSDILNSFVDSAIVIQEEGQIIATNSVWDEFTSWNHGNLGATGIGANYLEIYKNRFEGDLHKAQQSYYGILSDGKQNQRQNKLEPNFDLKRSFG